MSSLRGRASATELFRSHSGTGNNPIGPIGMILKRIAQWNLAITQCLGSVSINVLPTGILRSFGKGDRWNRLDENDIATISD
ncbi:MAG: hypothetical protein NT070_00410 [Cyanobacteria bacterium]|nr:hypothetical protein [Cyanobacteriota bacterium]